MPQQKQFKLPEPKAIMPWTKDSEAMLKEHTKEGAHLRLQLIAAWAKAVPEASGEYLNLRIKRRCGIGCGIGQRQEAIRRARGLTLNPRHVHPSAHDRGKEKLGKRKVPLTFKRGVVPTATLDWSEFFAKAKREGIAVNVSFVVK